MPSKILDNQICVTIKSKCLLRFLITKYVLQLRANASKILDNQICVTIKSKCLILRYLDNQECVTIKSKTILDN